MLDNKRLTKTQTESQLSPHQLQQSRFTSKTNYNYNNTGDDSYDSGLSSDHSGYLWTDSAAIPPKGAADIQTPIDNHHGYPPNAINLAHNLVHINPTKYKHINQPAVHFQRHNSDPAPNTSMQPQLQPTYGGVNPPRAGGGMFTNNYGLPVQQTQMQQSARGMPLRPMGMPMGAPQRLQYMPTTTNMQPQTTGNMAVPRHRYLSGPTYQHQYPAVLSKPTGYAQNSVLSAQSTGAGAQPVKRLVRSAANPGHHSANVLYNGDSDTGVYGSADDFAYYAGAKSNLGYSSDSELAVYQNMGNLSLGTTPTSYIRQSRRPGPSHSSDEQELYSSMRPDLYPAYASYDDQYALVQPDAGQFRTKFYPPYDSEYLSDPMLVNKHLSNVSSGPLSYFRKFSADLNNPTGIPDNMMSDIKSCSSDPATRLSDKKPLLNNSGGLSMSYFNAGGVSSPMTREDVLNLRGRQKFRVKDWEMARFSSKVNTSDFDIQPSDNYQMIKNKGTPTSSAGFAYSSTFPSNYALSREPGISGILMVHIIAGTGLHSSHAVLRDLYCVVEIDSTRKARSMIRTNTECFEWDEVFDLEVDCNRCISFLLYQWDPRNRHRLCFYGNKNLSNIVDSLSRLMAMSYQHQVTLKIALKLEPKGLLYIDLGYVPLYEAYNRVKMTHPSALFGAPLDLVIKRERTRWRVPCLIKKCVDEVDKRGLDVIGVYRLTGSAKLKAYIREMFERSPTDVDLSSERVPDLHAITAVLKDYLRELPEPLFTNSLYKMILDAVHVTLPGESHSRGAKLMLNILDCLPPTNQDTLLFLLDHLKRVTNKSDANKMTPLNLASSFAPVLLYPSPEAARLIDPDLLDLNKMTEIMRFILEIWPENKPFDQTDSFEGRKSLSYEQKKLKTQSLKPGMDRQHKSANMAEGGSLTSSRESDSSRHQYPSSARDPSVTHRGVTLRPQNSDSLTSAQRRRKTGPTKPSLRYGNRSSSDERRNYYHPAASQ